MSFFGKWFGNYVGKWFGKAKIAPTPSTDFFAEEERGPGYPEADNRMHQLQRDDDEILAVIMAFCGVKK